MLPQASLGFKDRVSVGVSSRYTCFYVFLRTFTSC